MYTHWFTVIAQNYGSRLQPMDWIHFILFGRLSSSWYKIYIWNRHGLQVEMTLECPLLARWMRPLFLSFSLSLSLFLSSPPTTRRLRPFGPFRPRVLSLKHVNPGFSFKYYRLWSIISSGQLGRLSIEFYIEKWCNTDWFIGCKGMKFWGAFGIWFFGDDK